MEPLHTQTGGAFVIVTLSIIVNTIYLDTWSVVSIVNHLELGTLDSIALQI